jgi:phage FluMu protein Com
MAIEFKCSQCGKLLRVPDGSAGKKAKCPSCEAVVEVPAPTPPPAADDQQKPAPPSGPQVPVNPFADAKSAASSTERTVDPTNPYASPSYSSITKQSRPGSEQRRTGPPWEREGQSARTFLSTVGQVFSQTNSTFATMRRHGGLGAPLAYAVVGGMIGFLANLIYRLVITGFGAAVGGGGPDVAGEQAVGACGGLICAPLLIIVFLFIASFCIQLMLLLVGGVESGFDTFETTFRVCSYCYGSVALLSLIPCIGGCIQWIVGVVFMIMGIAAAHEITGGKAAAAVLVPVVICFVVPIVAMVVFVVGAIGMAEGGF